MIIFKNSLSVAMRLMIVLILCGNCLLNTAKAATSITYYGITWYFSADRPTGTFVNGEPWVLGPVTITSITPNPSQSTNGVQNGSMINPIPNTNFGFDSHPQVSSSVTYTASKNVALSFPFNLSIGDVLVSSIGQNTYPTYLKTVCALTVVGSAPATGSFRPSIFGTDRTIKFNINQMNWGVLKNYIAPASTPTKAEVTAMVPPLPWFEWSDIWSGNSLQPTDNTADGDMQYGRATAAKFGHVALWLNTNQSLVDKQAIAIQMVQNGIDIYEYVKNGGGYYHDGGHKCGRKLPVVFAAMMLNDATLKTWVGNPDIFQEDTQTWFVVQGDVGRPIDMTPYNGTPQPYIQSDVGIAEWGIRHRWQPDQDDRRVLSNGTTGYAFGYRTTVGTGMMGAWLAAALMGAQTVWNHPPPFSYMLRYRSLFGNGGFTSSQISFNNDMWGIYDAGITNPDNTAPTAPVNLVASAIAGNSLTLTWMAATDNIGVVAYDIYKDNVFNKTVAGSITTSPIIGLVCNTSYSFTVKARDAAGNTSVISNIEIPTTTGVCDPINIALNKTLTVSSFQNDAFGVYPGTGLVDGDESDNARWAAEVFPQWAEIDLGADYNLTSVNLYPYQGRAYQYIIETKPTGGVYSNIVNRSANTTTGTVLTDNVTGTGRYVKITVTGVSGSTSQWTSLNELKVYGTLASVVTGISEKTTSDITMIPNPTTGIVNLSTSSEWTLKSLDGKLLQTGTGKIVDLSKYANGVYIIVIGNKQEKIIKF